MKLAVDAIIEREGKILVIERKNPPYGLAFPGGMVEEDESCEDAVQRELLEETNLKALEIEQLGTYSKPDRDPRCRVVSVVFIVAAEGEPLAGDDAKAFKWVAKEDLKPEMLAFDHYEIFKDYHGLINLYTEATDLNVLLEGVENV